MIQAQTDLQRQTDDNVQTIPEVTIVGDPKAGEAYNLGFQDGQQGSFDHERQFVFGPYRADYVQGHDAGVSSPGAAIPEGPSARLPTEEEEGPEKPDEVPEYLGPEWTKYVRLRDRLRLWRMYKTLGDEQDARRYELSEQEREEYEGLFTKFVSYDNDSELPPPAEGESEGEEGEAEAE
jgi:hypothetical protein